jgi:ribosomal protein S18 acetylase RimI-like enzyme
MTVTYRAADPSDAEAVADMFAASFTDTFGHMYDPEDLADFLGKANAGTFRGQIDDPRYAFRLAFDSGRLVGFVKLGPPQLPIEPMAPDTIDLDQLYVLKDWHGRGIAAALMDWAMTTAGQRRARHVDLSVFVDNHRARRFYDRYGFEPVGRYDFMVGSHADEDIIMRKRL